MSHHDHAARLLSLTLTFLVLSFIFFTPPSRTAGGAARPEPQSLRQLALAANDLVTDPNTQTVYASVPSAAGAGAGSITPVNPATGTAGTPVPVGHEPRKLAISDDGQFIYVGLDGKSAVRRFDVATQSAGPQFSLTEDAAAPLTASDIEVAPGNPHTVAVARRRPGVTPSAAGVAVYDDGVKRPRTTAAPFHSNFIEFSATPELLYGTYVENPARYTFNRMAVGACGVYDGSGMSSADQDLFGADFEFANGLVYTGTGRVISPEGMALHTRKFEGVSPTNSLVAPEPRAGRVYFLSPHASAPGTLTLRVYDINTFQPLGVLDLPGVSSETTGPNALGSLVRWGADGLAFRAGGKIYFLQDALVGGTSPSFTPAPVPLGASRVLRGRVTDFRSPATRGEPGVTVNVTGSRTTSFVTDANGSYEIPAVGFCETLTLTPSKPGFAFSPPSRTVTDPFSAALTIDFIATPGLYRFPDPSVLFNELDGTVFVGVQRTGDLSQPGSVDYETSDGSASDRSDYSAAYGTLRFAPGEAAKSFPVLVVLDSIFEGLENFRVRLKNPVGARLEGNSELSVRLTDLGGPGVGGRTLQDPLFFVQRHYHDFLGRSGDEAGVSFWVGRFDGCARGPFDPVRTGDCFEAQHVNVSAAFFLSIEFQETGFLAYRTHKAAFGDLAGKPFPLDFRDFIADVRELGGGVQVGVGDWQTRLENNKQNYAADFVARPRFLDAYPQTMTPDDFVGALNANAGGALSPSERDALVNALTDGTMTRAQVLRAVAEDQTLKEAEQREAFVLMQYFGYLRRSPDADGYNFWLAKLDSFGGDFVRAEMVKAFLISAEYTARFPPGTFNIRS